MSPQLNQTAAGEPCRAPASATQPSSPHFQTVIINHGAYAAATSAAGRSEVVHSQNIARHPQISIVIFNSQARIGTGQGVYMSALATQLSGADLERGIHIYSHTSLGHGASEWKQEEVQADALYRLYRAKISEHWVLDPLGHPDHRIAVNLSSNM